uniref:Uncharacterized protein n=1 Tax=Arundo donax TaxID=35708 RepID=A0A0A9BVW7_ARUDO
MSSEIWSSEIDLDDDSELPVRRVRDLRLLDMLVFAELANRGAVVEVEESSASSSLLLY